ncbi:dynamin family protein [Halobacillus sp. KGW1]|uniref:dynamin family protein n=1 Tax=Halobacillus sp. KGW1 TaxID=1793726 RepID=UPI000782A7EE|nr:dynamin family protein [Halobacillus sp. KGW1]
MTTMTDSKLDQLMHVYDYLYQEGDAASAVKLLDLIEKVKEEETIIGFAGHFSAGKSTLINRLLGHELLPSSPIPTSANIVRLKTGSEKTIVFFDQEDPVCYEEKISMDMVKDLCRDGDAVKELTIQRPEGGLPSHVSVVDTPGVDSTNDADRLITEASLHKMDYMYYVMDYNHVQSEVNLQFLDEMQRRKKPFSLVINQIDKHKEKELTFESYKRSIEAALKTWGIHPEAVFYTTMRDSFHPESDWAELSQHFRALFDLGPSKGSHQAVMEAEMIMEESVRTYKEERSSFLADLKERKQTLLDQVENSPVDEGIFHETEDLLNRGMETFEERILNFLPNAYLMPSSLREYAEAFLEALQPNFKVGLLFSGKKTEEERKRREETFYEKLNASIQENLQWPLRERMLSIIDTQGLRAPELVSQVQNMDFQYPKERLRSLVESGASVTGAYVLLYTDQIAKDIRQEMKTYVGAWKREWEAALKRQQQEWKDKHEEAFAAYEEIQHINQTIRSQEAEIESYENSLRSHFTGSITSSVEAKVEKDLENRRKRIKGETAGVRITRKSRQETEAGEDFSDQDRTSSSSMMHATLERVDRTINAIAPLDGLQSLREQLQRKRERLKNRSFTIALFGAFSAGKSSFANALLGESVLPVSPNPTTATINKISPPSIEKPDRTLDVYVKNEKEMMEDLADIRRRMGLQRETLDLLYEEVRQKGTQSDLLDQKQLSFLEAFMQGYHEMREYLGTRMEAPFDEFTSYVADEKKSCFIESMELFYDCAWTKAGITLVDTPGADSVNARHTDVSFKYIKDADAVLFVTYYNHPFSQADQSFLTQLGRVKDSFAMDKMFFLLNAADLAASEEELQQVEMYMKEQLLGFQIRKPRLYSVSSLLALKEKQQKEHLSSGMEAFEAKFRSFLNEELASVLIQSMEADVSTAKQMVEAFISTSRMNEGQRKEEKRLLERQKASALALFYKEEPVGAKEAVRNKVAKQLHYVQERMLLNYNDFFKQFFNPAVINGRGQDMREQALEAYRKHTEAVEFELNQELKAVCLRMEQTLRELTASHMMKVNQDLKQVKESIHLEQPEWPDVPLPAIHADLHIDPQAEKESKKAVKSTRAFFERNEKEALRDTLLSYIRDALSDSIGGQSGIVTRHYQEQWDQLFMQFQSEWMHQTQDSFDRLLYPLENPIDVAHLEAVYKQLK